MKYLLDYQSGLLIYSDKVFIHAIHEIVRDNLEDVYIILLARRSITCCEVSRHVLLV